MAGAFPTFLQGSRRREDPEGLLTLLKDCFLSNTSREHPCCQKMHQETHTRNVKFCVCCSPGWEHLHPRGHDPGSTMLLTHSPAALHARDSWEAGLCRGRESGSTTTRRDDSCWSPSDLCGPSCTLSPALSNNTGNSCYFPRWPSFPGFLEPVGPVRWLSSIY